MNKTTIGYVNEQKLKEREINKLKDDKLKREKNPYRNEGYIIDKCQECMWYTDIDWNLWGKKLRIDQCKRIPIKLSTETKEELMKKFIGENIYYKGIDLIPDCRKFWYDHRLGPINPYGLNVKGTGV